MSVTIGPEFPHSKSDPQLFSLGGELDSSLCSGEKCGSPQDEATVGTSASEETCDWFWSRVKDTSGLSSTSGDGSKLFPTISLSSGDKWNKTWLEDSSDFSISISSSSWFDLANVLLWSFVSGDDPAALLSFDGVSGVSFGTSEDSGLSCTGEGLNLSRSLGDDVLTSP